MCSWTAASRDLRSPFGDPRLRDANPAPLSALDEEVEELFGLISPALQLKCAWERRILNAYQDIKGIFPERFV